MRLKYFLPLALFLPLAANAVEVTWSGFATLGFAQSDQPYKYQRFIDDQGSFNRDSILGGQLDLKLNQQWGATLQGKLAPSVKSDSSWDATLAWAFISWRPADDWLIRAGKLRLPLMLNTENTDVGATFDLARLPMEVYSIAPTTDVLGLSISKTWLTEESLDWTLEAYTGQARTYWRYYGRDMHDSIPSPGSWYLPIDMTSSGLVLTARDIDNVFRIGVHEVEASRVGEPTHVDIPFRTIGRGVGFYDLHGSKRVDKLLIPVQTIGASFMLPADFRVTAEYARMEVNVASEGLSRWGAYLAVSRRIGNWMPYVYYARMKSTDSALEKYKAINGNSVPPSLFYDANLINKSQKMAADIVSPYDQWTGAVGASYRLTPSSLVKMEWSHTQTGIVSSFVDAPAGGDSADQRINIFSLSYSLTF